MHRRPKAELLPLNTKIERTIINLKKVRATKAINMVEQREDNQNIHVVAIDRP